MSRIEILVAVNAIIAKGTDVLLTRRATHIREPGKWCLPGGHVEHGETWADSLTRELLEEIGVRALSPRLFGVYSDPQLTVSENPVRMENEVGVFGHFLVAVFVVSAFDGEVRTTDEVDAFDWFSATNLPRPMIRSHPIRLSDFWEGNWGIVR